MIRIGSVVLRVDDLERQVAFWEAALGYVRREVLTPGTTLEVHTKDSTLNATVAELPFYKRA